MIEKDPSNFEAWFLLAEEYLLNRQLSEALFAFSKALGKNDSEMERLVVQSLRNMFSTEKAGSIESEDSFEFEQEDPLEISEMETEVLDEDPIDSIPSKIRVIEGGKSDNVISLENRMVERTTFADVGGLDALKQTIEMKIIKPFTNPGLFSKFSKKTGGGILLYGPPGCGKTFIAKATAGEVGANFYPVHITEILSPYFGVSEQNLHNIFETARANKPSVLFFDEIDTLGYSRSKSSSDMMRGLVDSMLTELQSINTNTDKMLVIGATNMPWDVDSAFKRPGRFDKLVFVPPPDREARKVIFKLKLHGKPVDDSIVYDLLAEKTEHYSGADIENVIEIATENVLTEIMRTNKERLITMEDLLAAIQSTKPSTLEWMATVKNYIKYANQGGLYSDAAQYIRDIF